MEDVSLIIEGKEFVHWPDVEIRMGLDSQWGVTFSAPFEPDNTEFRRLFRPFAYHAIDLDVGGERLFTGTQIGVEPSEDPESNTVTVSAYSLPGVLEDCTPHTESYPLECNELKIKAIAERLCGPFGIAVVMAADEGPRFERVACEPEQKILDFLADLARQRSLVISCTPLGQLLFHQSVASGNPVARLEEGEQPLVAVTAQFSPQDFHSELTGIGPARSAKKGGKYTTKNPTLVETTTRSGRRRQRELVGLGETGLPDVLRPLTVKLDDTEMADVPTAIKARMGRMVANMATYTVEGLPTWRDPQGALWRPNTTITLKAPGAMIYEEYEFLIRGVTLRQEAESETATLELVIPGAFSGEVPVVMPWS